MAWIDAKQARLKFLDLPYGNDPRTKTLTALMDASRGNTQIDVQDFGSNGKLRDVKVVYFPPQCDPGDCSDSICTDDGTAVEPASQTFTLSLCSASPVYKLGINDVRNVDGNWQFSDTAMRIIRSQMDSARRDVNDKLNTKLISYIGSFPDGSATKLISLTDPTTGAIRPNGYFEIERAIRDAGLDNPFIVGGSEVFTWEKGLSIGGLNAQGQRIDSLPMSNAYYDKALEDAFADPTHGHIVAFAGDMLKFIPFSNYAGMFANSDVRFADLDGMFNSGSTYLYTVIPDGATGLLWDLKVVFDPKCDSWVFQIRLNFDLFKMPDYACNEEDVTGVFHFETCLPAAIECPDVPTT